MPILRVLVQLAPGIALTALAAPTTPALPEGMSLPATYNVHATLATRMTIHFRGTHRVSRVSKARDQLTLAADGTLSWLDFADDGRPVTGSWAETAPGMISHTYDADLVPRCAVTVGDAIRRLRGFGNAEVTCTVEPQPVLLLREGRRIKGADVIGVAVEGGIAPMDGRIRIRWRGRLARPV